MGVRTVYILPFFAFIRVEAVPPAACFANFRWDDCGKPPEPVMYYWKPGSRCEVGLWRGCLPNPNMFRDEYECVSTCIFTARAIPLDFHSNGIEDYDVFTDTTDVTTAVTEGTTGGNSTGTDGTDGTTGTGEHPTGTAVATTGGGNGTEATVTATVPATVPATTT